MNDRECISGLIDLSHQYGDSIDWIQGAGGNTSVKLTSGIAIKQSGFRFRDLSVTTGHVTVSLDRAAIMELYQKKGTPVENEAAYNALMQKICEGISGRPSIELSFHCFGRTLTVHTHPTFINVFTCSQEGLSKLSETQFKGASLKAVEYAKPGIELTFNIIQRFNLEADTLLPPVTLLGNHGLIVTADSAADVMRLTEQLEQLLAEIAGLSMVSDEWNERELKENTKLSQQLSDALQSSKQILAMDQAILHQIQKEQLVGELVNNGIVYPDAAVYAGKSILIIDDDSPENVKENVESFIQSNGHLPKVCLYNGTFYAIAAGQKEAAYIQEMFCDHLKVLYYIRKLNWTPQFLNSGQLDDLLNWDAEKHRQKMAQ